MRAASSPKQKAAYHSDQPDEVSLPAYIPDTPVSRQSLAQQYNHIAHNDRIVGMLLEQLEADGLVDETAIFIWSDHAEGLPPQELELFCWGPHPTDHRRPSIAPVSRPASIV